MLACRITAVSAVTGGGVSSNLTVPAKFEALSSKWTGHRFPKPEIPDRTRTRLPFNGADYHLDEFDDFLLPNFLSKRGNLDREVLSFRGDCCDHCRQCGEVEEGCVW